MKRYVYTLLILLSISYFLILSGCKETVNEPQNHLPKIESLTASTTTLLINSETTITCIATDEDGDQLTISWSAKRGTFPNGVVGVAVKWIAPSTAGTDTITATVNDGKQTIKGELEIIVGNISSVPTQLTPTNNATEISLSPTLTWNPVNDAISYTLQVSANNSFNSFVFNQSGLTNTNQQITGLDIATTYYWRVNSANIYGTSNWSNVFSFRTVAPPQAPTLITPTNNEIDISLTTNLSWNALSNATSYTLQVSENDSLSNFVFNQSGLTNTSQQISGLNYFTTYYWRVNAINSYGTSPWSSVWSFTAIGTAPQPPSLLSPSNNETNIPIEPTLTWNSVNYANSYTLQVSESNLFSNFVINQSGITTTSQILSGLKNSKVYYWRVRAENNYGVSNWSNTWTFNTVDLFPPILVFPSNNSFDITPTPRLSWNLSLNTSIYELQIAVDNSFTSIVYSKDQLNVNYHQVNLLNLNTLYYWRVRSKNSHAISSWSEAWNFTTAKECGTYSFIYFGKTYSTIKIGDQCWIKENLDVGNMILGNQNPSNNTTIEKYCYDNEPNNCDLFGGLYNWNEAMQYTSTSGAKGICPTGWHLPTLVEFEELSQSVNNNSNSLKEIGQGSGNGIGTNTSGFSALLGGNRNNSSFVSKGASTNFWSSTASSPSAYYLTLYNDSQLIGLSNNISNDYGFQIRCIRD